MPVPVNSAPMRKTKETEIYLIKCHITNSTANTKQTFCTNYTFSSVYTDRLKSYYISNIDSVSTKRGLETCLSLRVPQNFQCLKIKIRKIVAKMSVPHY